jgi:hypothetical protein
VTALEGAIAIAEASGQISAAAVPDIAEAEKAANDALAAAQAKLSAGGSASEAEISAALAGAQDALNDLQGLAAVRGVTAPKAARHG